MSWQGATLTAVALVVALGFAWYERSRPSSRVVALVAALAALAVAGRLVLTPLPNVVATTDVAFITGLALGAAPGFAVGALAAPISNIWLGQGPWTIWEMAGWGMAGLAGAAFGTLLGREPRRLALAAACAAVGLLYGLLLDFSFMVSYGGEVSLDRYAAVSAAGLPFNVAHATGNFAIAMAVGPALVRMIARYRERLEFTWHPAGALPVALVAALAAAVALAAPPPAAAESGAGPARAWLAAQRNPDGGFAASPGAESSVAMTGWAMLGLEAAGRNPLDVGRARRNPVAYLRANADRIASVGDLERTILALEGAGVDSRRFAGRDLVAELVRRRSGDGSWQGQVNLTAFGLLALRAAQAGDTGRAAAWLRRAQNDDGGWGFRTDAASDADSTGAALQALALAGSGRALERGVRYLRQAQRGDGGWSLAGGVTNSQSTAWAAQGLVAAGATGRALRAGLGYLDARQAGDGHYRYSAASDQTPVWVTGQALLAVTRSPLPLAAVARAPRATDSGREGDTSGASGGAGGVGGGKHGGAAYGGGGLAAGRGGKGGTGDASGGDAGGSKGSSDEERGEAARRVRAAAGAGAAGPEQLVPAPAAADGTDAAGESGSALPVALSLGGLAVALAGGWLWYRRTLP